MKHKLISAAALFSLLMVLLSAGLYLSLPPTDPDDEIRGYIVDLNEIEILCAEDSGLAAEKIDALQETMRNREENDEGIPAIPILCGAGILLILSAFGYLYFAVLRPFEKMKDFAAGISSGDFGLSLEYERSNYFGAFTWAFDSMKSEIVKARASEKEAVENNKTVIATLSHDIKTPIASIRAYTEALCANMDSSYEKRERFLSVIIKKCDEVAKLTDDLFLHALSDLDKLKIMPERIEICGFTESIIKELSVQRDDVTFERPAFTAYVSADRNRLVQICENIVNNGRKYAKTGMDVFFTREGEDVLLHFRDYGEGIPDENLPFVFDKFYRGNNTGGEQGSGLGLYIVKYIAEKMGGRVSLHNRDRGLEVIVALPIK